MSPLRPTQARADDFVDVGPYSKLRADRRLGRDDLAVWADCSCGWWGPTRWCEGVILTEPVGEAVRAGRAAHEEETGHGEDPEIGAEGRHDFGCGFYHRLNVSCPLPPTSPAGRVRRALGGTLTDRRAAVDRLAAVDELRGWLSEQEREAVLGARLARVTWVEMGAAVGISRQGAHNRWGAIVKNLEAAGVLRATPEAPVSVPADPSAATLRDAREWCRFCGHRVVAAERRADGSWRWEHREASGRASDAAPIDVECPGPEPWPRSHEWLGV